MAKIKEQAVGRVVTSNNPNDALQPQDQEVAKALAEVLNTPVEDPEEPGLAGITTLRIIGARRNC